MAKPLEIVAFPRPQVILVIGVNGSGKTTTIAKLAHLFQEQDYGGDAGRRRHLPRRRDRPARGLGRARSASPIVRGPEGGDPASIVFDAVKRGDRHAASTR